jgi:hypothetical protein
MYALYLDIGKETQSLQFGAVGTIDIDWMGMQIDVVIVEVLGQGPLLTLNLSLKKKLFDEGFPCYKLR